MTRNQCSMLASELAGAGMVEKDTSGQVLLSPRKDMEKRKATDHLTSRLEGP